MKAADEGRIKDAPEGRNRSSSGGLSAHPMPKPILVTDAGDRTLAAQLISAL
jgi:hypothetical protein